MRIILICDMSHKSPRSGEIRPYRLRMEKGMEKGEAAFFTRLLNHKFGTLPSTVQQPIDNARPEELALWGERILDGKNLDEVFL
uniref:DUF4351 domain-containing protein n=2 Tax=Candidatus Kentrum sp. TUN TaxID=2126343 RepID=A0A450ZM90_9GAMM|nr:MAG: protein of unknown function (DUF4351) [Candidatus Kentron sp. TUN]